MFFNEESENNWLTNRFQDWIDEEIVRVQRRLLTLALDNFEHGRWGRLNKNALKRKNSHPNGWTDLRYATLPLSITDHSGAVMEFNSIYVHDPESTYVRGAVERIFFLTLRDEGGSRSVVVFKFPGGERDVPQPWKEYAKGLQARDANFRYKLLNTGASLPVFVSSASTSTLHSATGLGFTPTPSSRTDCVRTRERIPRTTDIKNQDPELYVRGCSHRSDFWLPEDCS